LQRGNPDVEAPAIQAHRPSARVPLALLALVAPTFHLARNHYDRLGHVALGFFPVCIIKEVLLRKTPLRRGGWFTFLVLSVVLAIAAVWEFVEWGATYVFAADVGQAFLGSQGDVWDAHWDMLLGLIGGAAGFHLLGPIHDRSMARVVPS
jgi:putative membrane protein